MYIQGQYLITCCIDRIPDAINLSIPENEIHANNSILKTL